MDHVIGFATRGISSTIAITPEAIGHHKSSNATQTNPDHSATIISTPSILDSASQNSEDEDDQIAREKNPHEIAPPSYVKDATELVKASPSPSVEEVSQTFLTSHPTVFSKAMSFKPLPIPAPVIIPQRRPRDRDRGFVRAYAPILGECSGIDEATFISFLDSFQAAARASPVFDVINIACFGVGMVPNVICIAVSSTVYFVNDVAKELQIRYRSNKFLDNVNENLFMPRGLFAMVMTYKPDMPDDVVLTADTANGNSLALFKTLSHDNSKLKEKLKRLRASSGKAGEASFSECAPLVYPGIDLALSASQSRSPTQKSLKTTSDSVKEYLDHRAQATFIAENPNTKLAQTLPPSKPFASRFSDPDHPVNSGSIFGLVTGGNFDPIATGRVSRAEAKAKKAGEPPLTAEEKHNAYMGRLVRGKVTGTPSKDIPLIGKLLKKDVLYLMIVNLPTQEEMKELGRKMAKA